jgi:hypothetical protein
VKRFLNAILFPFRNNPRGAAAKSAGGRRRSPNNLGRARLAVETLEDRTVPTVVFKPTFGPDTVTSQLGGLQSPAVHMIFSGTYWATSQGQQDEATLLNSTGNILNGPYLSGLTQYGSDGHANFVNSWQDSGTVALDSKATDGSTVPSGAALQGYLQNSIFHHPGNTPGYNDPQHLPIYIVVSDPASAGGNAGGWNRPGAYNTWYSLGGHLWFFTQPMKMIWVGTAFQGSSVSKDSFTLTLSHELAESMSRVTITAPSGLPANVKGDSQICDNEGNFLSYRLNGDLVDSYWSAQDGGFIVPDGNPLNLFVNPNWTVTNGQGSLGAFTLQVQGDQRGANTNDSIRIDQDFTTLGVTVNLDGSSFEFDPVTVGAVKVDTGGGKNDVYVEAVPAGVSVDVNSTGTSDDFVQVGSDFGQVQFIQGPVNVHNDGGHTYLYIDNSNGTTQNITITDHSVAFSNGATVTYGGWLSLNDWTFHGVTQVDIFDGAGANQIEVDSAPLWGTNVDVWGGSLDSVFGAAAGQINMHRLRWDG